MSSFQSSRNDATRRQCKTPSSVARASNVASPSPGARSSRACSAAAFRLDRTRSDVASSRTRGGGPIFKLRRRRYTFAAAFLSFMGTASLGRPGGGACFSESWLRRRRRRRRTNSTTTATMTMTTTGMRTPSAMLTDACLEPPVFGGSSEKREQRRKAW